MTLERLRASLADRYRIELKLGQAVGDLEGSK